MLFFYPTGRHLGGNFGALSNVRPGTHIQEMASVELYERIWARFVGGRLYRSLELCWGSRTFIQLISENKLRL